MAGAGKILRRMTCAIDMGEEIRDIDTSRMSPLENRKMIACFVICDIKILKTLHFSVLGI